MESTEKLDQTIDLDKTISFKIGDLKDLNLGYKYQIQFLGTGAAFYTDIEALKAGRTSNWQSNLVLTATHPTLGTRRMLWDAGGDVRFSLGEQGLTAWDINDVYISHPHADHVGGMEYIGFMTHFAGKPKPNLIIDRSLAYELWSKSLSGGMDSKQGEAADLDTYFNLQRVGKKGQFSWCGLNMKLIQVVHIMSDNRIMPSFGLEFKANGKNVFWTSDTQFNPEQIVDFYNAADLILHDCETTPFKSRVHAHYDQLKTLPAETKAKMWLYHYQFGPKADAVADGFKGWAQKGQVIEL